MAWVAPAAFTTGEVVTAAKLNQNINSNTLALQATGARVITLETTASTSYVDLTTTGPSVTVTTPSTALVFIGAQMSNTAAGQCYAALDISGATTVAAADDFAIISDEQTTTAEVFNMGKAFRITGLTPGSNTFKMKYHVQTGTGSFSRREIIVIAA